MLHQNSDNINTSDEINVNFIGAVRELKISKLLGKCGIRKTARKIDGETSSEKRTAFEIFQFLVLMVFQGSNLYRFLGSKKQDIACSKSTYHRFLNDCHYNWRRFITLLASAVIDRIDPLTENSRFKAFVLEDSVIGRKRSKRVELLAFVFDHVIGMLKDNRQFYHYRGKLMNLRTLAAHHVRMVGDSNMLGSVIVRTRKFSIPVKLVFVRNRNSRNEYIIILSTDCSLSDEEIVRRYSYRWQIECCFKVCKSLLKLGKEFQPVNYDTTVSTTALVFSRFIILEWLRRKNNDWKTMGELFFYI